MNNVSFCLFYETKIRPTTFIILSSILLYNHLDWLTCDFALSTPSFHHQVLSKSKSMLDFFKIYGEDISKICSTPCIADVGYNFSISRALQGLSFKFRFWNTSMWCNQLVPSLCLQVFQPWCRLKLSLQYNTGQTSSKDKLPRGGRRRLWRKYNFN